MTYFDPRMADGAARAVLLTGPFGDPERVIDLARPMTVAEIIECHGLEFTAPTIAVMNGEPIMRGTWALRMVREGEVIAFVAVPRGGGDGAGKQIVGLVAALALSLAAPIVGTALSGMFFAGSTLAASAISAAFLVGGSMLLNTLLAPAQEAAETAATVYSANASGNQATPLEIIPDLYGTLRFPPRVAGRPYSEYQGNDQFLYQLFALTVGKANIKRIEIGDTLAWSADAGYSATFSDLTFEIIQPGQNITLFPANVVTSTEVSAQVVPDAPFMLGPFVLNDAGTTINRIAVDFAFPGGLYKSEKKGVSGNSIPLRAEYQPIDNTGAAIGPWSNVFRETIAFATRTPQRLTRGSDVAPGRYQVRFLAEASFDSADADAVNTCVWTGLRGYLTGFVTPPNCTLLAMRIRANEQLSQVSASQIFVTATRCLPIWNGAIWSDPVETRSPAWAAADLLRDTDYGLGLNERQYDVGKLQQLAATWAGRGDTFNAIFDRPWTAAEALRAILRVGRATPVRIAGQIGFNRLEAKSIKRAMFTARNVARGSFLHKLVLFDDEKPDSVNGSYIDETVWDTREVLGAIATIGAEDPQKVDYFGITNHDHCWREAVTEAAINAYQREFVSFTADWEGKLLVRGDPILIQHPFIEGIGTGSLVSAVGNVLTLDRDLAAPEDEGFVIIRSKRGTEWGPCKIAGMTGRTVTLDAGDRAIVELSMGALVDLLPHAREERAHVLVCDGTTRPFNGLLVSATPNGSGKVDILAVIDAPEVYAADLTETKPSPWTVPALPDAIATRPVLSGLYAELQSGVGGLEVEAMWLPTAGAIGGYVAQVSYDDGASWTPVYSGAANRFTASVLPQTLKLGVAAIGLKQGPWAFKTFHVDDLPEGGGYIDLGAINESFQAVTDVLTGSGPGSLTSKIAALRETIAKLAVADTDGTTESHRQITLLTSEFQDNAAAVLIQLETLATADTALASLLNQVAIDLNGVSANGLFQMQAIGSPAGVSVRLALLARKTTAEVFIETGFVVDIFADNTTRIAMKADEFYLLNATGTAISSPFSVVGGVVYMDEVVINGATIQTLTVGTEKLIVNAVTAIVVSSPGPAVVQIEQFGEYMQSMNINVVYGIVKVGVTAYQNRPGEGSGNFGTYRVVLERDGAAIRTVDQFYDDNFSQPISFEHSDDPGVGVHNYRAYFTLLSGDGNFTAQDTVLSFANHKR